MSVPDVASYKNMEPVKSHWQQHNALGASLVSGLKGAGVKIFSGGSMAMDLTRLPIPLCRLLTLSWEIRRLTIPRVP